MRPNWEHIFRTVCPLFVGMGPHKRWFFCFGTMLSIVRSDMRVAQGKEPKFPQKQDDVDVGVFYDEFEPVHVKNFCAANGWVVDNRIVSDTTGKPLFTSLRPRSDVVDILGDVHIDIFCWVKHDGHYWHTYDTEMKRPKNGKLSRYTFKGIPEWMLSSGVVERLNVGGSRHYGFIPAKYGSCLDEWYPDWLVPQECVSKGKVKVVKSCKEMGL